MALKILVICGRAKQRSLTAETIYTNSPSINVRAAGISKDSDIPVTEELIEWANRILVMENTHKSKLSRKFGHVLANKKIRVLNIPDKFRYMDPVLIDKLQSCIKQYT